MRMTRTSRSGVSVVQFAISASVVFLLTLGLIVGGFGVFRYQEVAHLAREGARYASTHGGQYTLDGRPAQTGVPAVASASDVQNYLLPRTTLLDPNFVQVSIDWSSPAALSPRNMPIYTDSDPTLVPPAQKTIRNNVSVTVTYQWMPEVYLVGPITLSSTSTMPMTY
jgi:Flp pilus assembly protein TadG